MLIRTMRFHYRPYEVDVSRCIHKPNIKLAFRLIAAYSDVFCVLPRPAHFISIIKVSIVLGDLIHFLDYILQVFDFVTPPINEVLRSDKLKNSFVRESNFLMIVLFLRRILFLLGQLLSLSFLFDRFWHSQRWLVFGYDELALNYWSLLVRSDDLLSSVFNDAS